MLAVLQFLVEQPVVLLFLFVGIGTAIGHIKIKGISFGAAAVLFVAMGFSALAVSQGIEIDSESFIRLQEVLEIIGSMGLALFTYTIGVISGPAFFSSLRTGLGPILGTVAALVAGAGVAVGIGMLLQLPETLVAGAFAGAVTNTPALASAIDAAGNPAVNSPTIGYSVTYLFGVLGALAITALALSKRAHDTDAPEQLTNITIRMERSDSPTLGDIEDEFDNQISFSRIQHGEENPINVATDDETIDHNDLVTVVGPHEHVEEVAEILGHKSSHNLEMDRRFLDFRRITLSNGKLAGQTIGSLNLGDRFNAVVTRVRRGDIDMIATDSLVLAPGDRLRVIAPTKRMKAVSEFLGDSARGLSDINPIALGLGMGVGVLIGSLTIPIGTGFSLGAAAGTLLVGLVLGRVARIGPMITSMPNIAATALSEFGLLIFLAFAGVRAGGQIVTYWDPNQIISLLIVGVVSTSTVVLLVYILMRRGFKMGGTKLAGVVGGTQTQPAVLAFANQKTEYDNRVSLGYALVYPTAMVAKILIAQFLGGM